MQDALSAWTEDDYAKVATLAPLAVEQLGKAVLWNADPALLVPLSQDAEPSPVSGHVYHCPSVTGIYAARLAAQLTLSARYLWPGCGRPRGRRGQRNCATSSV
jgi:hypothetical protein